MLHSYMCTLLILVCLYFSKLKILIWMLVVLLIHDDTVYVQILDNVDRPSYRSLPAKLVPTS
jgi:hypothetical protein